MKPGVSTVELEAQLKEDVLLNMGDPELLPEPVIIQFYEYAF